MNPLIHSLYLNDGKKSLQGLYISELLIMYLYLYNIFTVHWVLIAETVLDFF